MMHQPLSPILDRAWIENHIPHQGSMCLLSSVQSWNQEKITCLADSHFKLDNPLRAYGKLGVSCGIEYAAQAMAVHGALLAPTNSEAPKVGYLVSVRGATMFVTRLDDIVSNLLITAICIMANESNMLYQFTVSADDKLLLEGRAAIVLDANALVIE